MQKIKTALLSFGMSGRVFHGPFIQLHPGFKLVGAWERSTKNLQKFYPDSTSYDSLESLLQDETIDLVVVNTPTYSHYEYAMKALDSGKHVVVEKAFTTTVAEAQELQSLAVTRNVKLSVFQNRRWDSDFKTVQSIVNKGVLGNIVDATFSYDRYNPALSPKLHKEIPGPGAGIVNDLGPHLIDQVLVLFGMPEKVFGTLAITREHSKVDDYFEILLYYKNLLVRLKGSYFAREPVPSYIVNGTKGTFLKSRADVQEAMLQAGHKPGSPDWGTEPEKEQGLLHTEFDGKILRERVQTLQGNYFDYYDGMYKAITTGSEVPVSAEDGVRVMRIIEAAFKSHQEGKIVELA